jgi:hypothetical protein
MYRAKLRHHKDILTLKDRRSRQLIGDFYRHNELLDSSVNSMSFIILHDRVKINHWNITQEFFDSE